MQQCVICSNVDRQYYACFLYRRYRGDAAMYYCNVDRAMKSYRFPKLYLWTFRGLCMLFGFYVGLVYSGVDRNYPSYECRGLDCDT